MTITANITLIQALKLMVRCSRLAPRRAVARGGVELCRNSKNIAKFSVFRSEALGNGGFPGRSSQVHDTSGILEPTFTCATGRDTPRQNGQYLPFFYRVVRQAATTGTLPDPGKNSKK